MMEEGMMEIIVMIKNMVMVFLNGLIIENTREIGKMENNTGKEFISGQMESKEKENGLMEKELDGLHLVQNE